MSEPYQKVINVLDHGYVRLADYMGSDLSIVRAARVSHDASWRTGLDAGKDEKLIRYLMKNSHNTPFEMVEFCFEVKLPIFVVRQWHRHRTWSYNEVSARYTELPAEFYVPDIEKIGSQDQMNKQSRDLQTQHLDEYGLIQSRNLYIDKCNEAFQHYKFVLGRGWPREIARCVLPFSTYTKMFAKVDLHNLLHFLNERLAPGAQYEIRVYAQAILELITPIVPVAVAAWEEKRLERSTSDEFSTKIGQLEAELQLLRTAAEQSRTKVGSNADFYKYSH